MIEEGTIDTLIKIMKLNPYNEKIQHLINNALKAFLINDEVAQFLSQKLGAAGFSTFVHSMKKHVEPVGA